MGGYAALAYSALVPGATVLAFSPQTSLSRKVARFEQRFRYAQRKWDWSDPAFLDAAASVPAAAEVVVVFDPFVPEDHAHARRIHGRERARRSGLDHLGHKAIRHLKSLGILQPLIADVAVGRFEPEVFWRGLRARRNLPFWQRSLLAEAERRGHARLARAAANALVSVSPDRRFARRLAGTAPPPTAVAADSAILGGNPAARPPFTGQILHLARRWSCPNATVTRRSPRASCTPTDAGASCRAPGSGHARQRRSRRSCLARRSWTCRARTCSPGISGAISGISWWNPPHVSGRWTMSASRLDSILYLPYRGALGAVERAIEGQAGFFRLLGIDTPVRTYGTALRVERLHVPELGFGWLERYAGSPAYRAFMQGRLNAAVKAEGGEKLYISRARLNAQRGGVLGETVIEENLARAGYDVFHPEKHPLEVQIARYKAARQIVALDGSALHLAAYVLRPGSQVAMILRRSKANAEDYRLQFRSFCGVDPQVIDVIRRDWVAGASNRVDFRSVGEIDFAALFARLRALSFLPADFQAELPSAAEIAAMLAAYEGKRGMPFRPLGADEPHPDEDEA